MISDERMEKALGYLAETDEKYAELKVDVERMDFVADQVKDAVLLSVDGTVPEKHAKARTSGEYEAAMNDYFDAKLEAMKMGGKRTTEELVFKAWQSLNSNRRAGMVT